MEMYNRRKDADHRCLWCSWLLRRPLIEDRKRLRGMQRRAEPGERNARAIATLEKSIEERHREHTRECKARGINNRNRATMFCTTCNVCVCVRCWGPFHGMQNPLVTKHSS